MFKLLLIFSLCICLSLEVCPDNCVECNGDVCNKCKSGFYLGEDNSCTICNDPQCDSCSAGVDVCEVCLDGY